MRFLPFAISAVWAALDQLLKWYSVTHLRPYDLDPAHNAATVVPGFLSLALTYNTGAAWSLFSNGTLVLTVLRAAVGVGLLVYLWRRPRLPLVQVIALALIVGGAFGNAIDGFFRGRVVDMLLSHTLSAVYQPFAHTVFPIFNVADTGVVSGVILLLIASLFEPKKAGELRA